jgi:hypothetical protein
MNRTCNSSGSPTGRAVTARRFRRVVGIGVADCYAQATPFAASALIADSDPPHRHAGQANLLADEKGATCAAFLLPQPRRAVLDSASIYLRAAIIDDGDRVIITGPINSTRQPVDWYRRQDRWDILHHSLLAADPSGEAPELRCQGVTASFAH